MTNQPDYIIIKIVCIRILKTQGNILTNMENRGLLSYAN